MIFEKAQLKNLSENYKGSDFIKGLIFLAVFIQKTRYLSGRTSGNICRPSGYASLV